MSTIDRLVEENRVSRSVPLGQMTTYKSGGPARYYTEVADEGSLIGLVETGALEDLPILVLGRGSNLVVSDRGFPGLVIRLGPGFSVIEVDGTTVTAGGATSLARLARASVDAGLTGLEFFVGIPGSVGGALRQNAGCFGTETKDRLVSARILDLVGGRAEEKDADRLALSYRHSNIEPTDVVLGASFRGVPGDTSASRAELRRITRWRRDHQPGGTLNAGSVFKNPPHISAGELIDSLGLKGMRVGDVAVSDKHANFFVAGPRATSADILSLVTAVRDRVFELSGTILEPEIQFVGFE